MSETANGEVDESRKGKLRESHKKTSWASHQKEFVKGFRAPSSSRRMKGLH